MPRGGERYRVFLAMSRSLFLSASRESPASERASPRRNKIRARFTGSREGGTSRNKTGNES